MAASHVNQMVRLGKRMKPHSIQLCNKCMSHRKTINIAIGLRTYCRVTLQALLVWRTLSTIWNTTYGF